MSEGENTNPPQSVPTPEKDQVKTLEEVIREKAPEILKTIPESKRGDLAAITIEQRTISMRSAPLPEPSELEAYNKIIPNGADRILKMAENQSAHRIEIEKLVIASQQRQGFCGQLFGLLIGLSGLGLATFAAVRGQPWFGSVIGGATLVSLVSTFLYSRQSQKKELGQKKDQMQPVLPPQNTKKKYRNR